MTVGCGTLALGSLNREVCFYGYWGWPRCIGGFPCIDTVLAPCEHLGCGGSPQIPCREGSWLPSPSGAVSKDALAVPTSRAGLQCEISAGGSGWGGTRPPLAGKAGNTFHTKHGNRISCRDQEGRWGSDEVGPGPSVFPSVDPGVSGDFCPQQRSSADACTRH